MADDSKDLKDGEGEKNSKNAIMIGSEEFDKLLKEATLAAAQSVREQAATEACDELMKDKEFNEFIETNETRFGLQSRTAKQELERAGTPQEKLAVLTGLKNEFNKSKGLGIETLEGENPVVVQKMKALKTDFDKKFEEAIRKAENDENPIQAMNRIRQMLFDHANEVLSA